MKGWSITDLRKVSGYKPIPVFYRIQSYHLTSEIFLLLLVNSHILGPGPTSRLYLCIAHKVIYVSLHYQWYSWLCFISAGLVRKDQAWLLTTFIHVMSVLRIIRIREGNFRKRIQATWNKKRKACESNYEISAQISSICKN